METASTLLVRIRRHSRISTLAYVFPWRSPFVPWLTPNADKITGRYTGIHRRAHRCFQDDSNTVGAQRHLRFFMCLTPESIPGVGNDLA